MRWLASIMLIGLVACDGSNTAAPDGSAVADAARDTAARRDGATPADGADARVRDGAASDTAASDAAASDTAASDTAARNDASADGATTDSSGADAAGADAADADTGSPIDAAQDSAADAVASDTTRDTAAAADTTRDTAPAADTTSDTSSDTGPAPDTTADAGVATCSGVGFSATPSPFALPTIYAKGYFNDTEGSSNCDSFNGYARPAYTSRDIDGDGRPDMIVTYACGSSSLAGADPDVGKTKWRIHKNTGSGFENAGVDWALPTIYAKGYFNATEGSSNCDSFNGYARPAYTLRDIDGDGRPDLIVTYACGSSSLAGADPNVGKTKWRIHKNTGSGFENAGVDWALPTIYAKGYFNATEGSSNCDSFNGYARPAYTLRDIDGDGRPDMVVTYACGSSSLAGADPNVGKTKWRIHKNTGSGFENAGVAWPLPTIYAKGYFNDTEGSSNCDSFNGYARPAYRLLDIGGDARPDMVVTYACGSSSLAGADANVGKTKWRIHKNTGSGFENAGVDWALPTGYAKGYFNDTQGSSNCDSFNGYARPAYQLRDLDGTGGPDMLVTYACGSSSLAGADANVGKTYWLVHSNTGSGFGQAATTWCLPTGYAKGYFNDTQGSSNCDSFNGYARPAYRTAQLAGSARREMVVTYACGSSSLAGADADVGKTKWLTH